MTSVSAISDPAARQRSSFRRILPLIGISILVKANREKAHEEKFVPEK